MIIRKLALFTDATLDRQIAEIVIQVNFLTAAQIGAEAVGTVAAHVAAFIHADIAHANRAALDLVSGANTGDQDLSGLVPKVTTVNGHALTGNITVTASDTGAEPANANIQAHVTATSNPHGTTAAQVGAVPALAAVPVNAACTDLPTAVALINQIRGALIANGICI